MLAPRTPSVEQEAKSQTINHPAKKDVDKKKVLKSSEPRAIAGAAPSSSAADPILTGKARYMNTQLLQQQLLEQDADDPLAAGQSSM